MTAVLDTLPEASKPTREEVIKLLRADARKDGLSIGEETAAYIDEMVARAVSEIRSKGRGGPTEPLYILTDEDMSVTHLVLDYIMPDEAASTPGSAHEAFERRHLDFGQGELRLVHTVAENRGDSTRFCALVIAIDTVG